MKMKKLFSLVLCFALVLTVFAVFTACDKKEEHTHTYADAWNYDESNHWHDATCEHTDEVSDRGGSCGQR